MDHVRGALGRVLHHPDPVFVILWTMVAVVGMAAARDYGLSWDEPLYYKYGEAVGYAYSPANWFSGSFNLEKAYGPSAEDHKLYGAAYLLSARPFVVALNRIAGWQEGDAWHLVNFLFYMVGIAFFYALCKRVMSSTAAVAASGLMATQPLLWGHAFINPKDVPFLAFFIAAVYLGFRMVDQGVAAAARAREHPGAKLPSGGSNPKRTVLLYGATLLCSLLALLSYMGEAGLRHSVSELVTRAYHAPAGSTWGQLFHRLAPNADTVPAESYVAKSWILFLRARLALWAASFLLLLASAAALFPRATRRILGFVDRILAPSPRRPSLTWAELTDWRVLGIAVLPGIVLGMLTSIRIVGPLAGALVLLYFFSRPEKRSLAPLLAYLAVAFLALLATWPYLWQSPVARLVEATRHMADNPKIVPVLFNGAVFMSTQLPRDYLPRLLAITLTEPILPLFIGGLVVAALRLWRRSFDWRAWVPLLAWFFVPFVYVLVRQPALYDGYRHFLFVLPPAFILVGAALDWVAAWLKRAVFVVPVLVVLMVPGLLGIARMHPYEYAYYDSFTGGPAGAFRHYETDYWLTCYREAMADLAVAAPGTSTLYVRRQPSLARQYAPTNTEVHLYDPEVGPVPRGSLLLLTTRTNSDVGTYPDSPVLLTVGREGATFCLVKRITAP